MKRLILMRHAKSDWSLDQGDHDRVLNTRGRKSASALGDWLRRKGYLPDLALCSDAARTRETLALLDLTCPVHHESALYLANPQTLTHHLQRARGDTVLLVAHNPGIGILAGAVVDSPPDHDRFETYPTGATLVADCDMDSWDALSLGRARSVDFIVPRDLF